MDLVDWIDLIGKKKVAEMLGVTSANISQWVLGHTSPKVMTAHKIVTMSHGVLTWEAVYRPYVHARLAEWQQDQVEMKL